MHETTDPYTYATLVGWPSGARSANLREISPLYSEKAVRADGEGRIRVPFSRINGSEVDWLVGGAAECKNNALETSAVPNVCQTAQHRVRIYLIVLLSGCRLLALADTDAAARRRLAPEGSGAADGQQRLRRGSSGSCAGLGRAASLRARYSWGGARSSRGIRKGNRAWTGTGLADRGVRTPGRA